MRVGVRFGSGGNCCDVGWWIELERVGRTKSIGKAGQGNPITATTREPCESVIVGDWRHLRVTLRVVR